MEWPGTDGCFAPEWVDVLNQNAWMFSIRTGGWIGPEYAGDAGSFSLIDHRCCQLQFGRSVTVIVSATSGPYQAYHDAPDM
jgi:hypothetical protein